MSTNKKMKELENAIERLENGIYQTHPASWCADTISWLHRYHPELREKLEGFADRMTAYFKDGGC